MAKRVLRLSKRHLALLKEEERVEPDLRFWLIHALHWHALIVVVATGMYIGYMFQPGSEGATAATVKPSTTVKVTATVPKEPVKTVTKPLPMAQAKAQFTKDLRTGTKHAEVKLLQQFLNTQGYVIVKTGPGSPGKETDLFGAGTRTALAALQAKNGLTSEKGVVGPKTRKYLNDALLKSASIAAKPSQKPATPPDEIPYPTRPASIEMSAPKNVGIGKKFTVLVSVKGAVNIDTARLIGSFDQTLLKLDKVDVATFDSPSPGNFINNTSGTFSFGEFALTKRINGNVQIAVMTFTPKKAGKARVHLHNGSIFLVGGQDVQTTYSGVEVVITGGKK